MFVCMQVEYRKDFEKSKGTVMSVADDPSLQHARQAGMNASAFNYSGGVKELRSQTSINNNYDDYEGACTIHNSITVITAV